MAMEWARGNGSISNQEAVSEIEAMAQLEESLIGTYVDTSVADVMKLVSAYYDYGQVEAFEIQSPRDIIERINRGEIVVVPTNGQRLNNPFYTPPGPERHSLVIRGYDFDTEEFITNDPGTRRGEAYRYDKNVLFGAIGDYPTGDHKPYVEPLEKRGYSIWR